MKTIFVVLITLSFCCHQPVPMADQKISRAQAQKEYADLLQKENKKTEEADSIFYGIYFKMTKNSFFSYCNDMFKKGVFRGSYDYQVVVDPPGSFSKPVTLKFYPSFEKPFIGRLECRFQFTQASLYNENERAGKLAIEIVREMMNWYGGNSFIKMPSLHPLKGPEYVKIDANRKITLTEADNGIEVEAVYEDLKPLF